MDGWNVGWLGGMLDGWVGRWIVGGMLDGRVECSGVIIKLEREHNPTDMNTMNTILILVTYQILVNNNNFRHILIFFIFLV